MTKIKLALVLVLIVAAGLLVYHNQHSRTADATAVKTNIKKATSAVSTQKSKVSTLPPVNNCAANTATQAVIVSLSQQHLWVCAGQASVNDTAVTTGATAYGDGTPTGSWAIYSKQTDRHLTGSDDRGSWDDFVNYWMPFNGDYGFHDATWQTFPFGDLTKYTTQGSHGCVHLPLDAMKWLYNWSSVGTAVNIEA